MDNYYDSAMDDEGPIVQEIPDSLMVGDYIEIHGICRGPEVIVQLLSRSDPTALPLHITMSAGGPVLVKSQSKDKVESQERNARMCLQPNLDFVLCIYAMEDGYEIKLNQNTLCFQKHLLKLDDISAISMDGDADFTSIEFKDIYGDGEEENPYAQEDPGQGMMRVHELRESFSRHRGSPMLVRSSVRRSNRSNRDVNLNKTNWPTSNDLSRTDYEVDIAREASTPVLRNETPSQPATISVTTPDVHGPSPKTKSRFSWKPGSRKSFTVEENKHMTDNANRVLAGETHSGVYTTAEDGYTAGSLGTLNASTASLADKSKKSKRTSLFGKLRKSKGSEPDVSIEGTEKSKRKGLKNPFKSRKSINVAPLGETRQSYSMPDVTGLGSSVYSRLSTDIDPKRKGVDTIPVAGPIPKKMQKSAAPEMAAYVFAQKAVPEFENYSLTNRDLRELPALSIPTSQVSQRASVLSTGQDRKLKGTAPEIADTLLDTNRAGFDQSAALTSNQPFEPLPVYTRRSLSGQSETSLGKKSLKGPAPEIASVLDSQRYPPDTVLTHESVMDGSLPSRGRSSAIPITTPTKLPEVNLKGPAPEIAASLYERHASRLDRMPETTYLGTVSPSRQGFPSMERPIIDYDPIRPKTTDSYPQYQSRPVFVNRPESASHRRTTNDDSDASSIHSDGEYYLEVGKSDYYFDRRRSLHNYRSRKARRQQQESQDSSARSSISSLKTGDKVIVPKATSSLDSRHQVNTWLNGYNKEPEIHASRPNTSKVYAAAPVAEYSEPVQLTMRKTELRQADNVARFPLALTPGRSAVLVGHFLNEDPLDGNCIIRLSSIDQEVASNFDALLFQLGRNGEFSIQGSTTGETFKISDYTALNIKSPSDYEPNFTLEYYARGHYFAVTVNQFISIIIHGSFDPSSFRMVEMLPGSNAELDYFSVASELTIPITLKYPISSYNDEAQSVTLNTRMNADSKSIRMQFQTETKIKFDVVLDFVDGYVYAEPVRTDDGCTIEKETARQSIPFVPEQIRKLVVRKKRNDNILTIFANHKEIFQQPISLPKPYANLSQVHVRGDMLLLGTSFE